MQAQEDIVTAESDFKKYLPAITEVTVLKAAETYGLDEEILSLNGRGVALDAFILLLATGDEARGPFLLNGVCARELCALLLAEGFGPRST